MSIAEDERSSFGLACRRGPTRGMTAAHRHDDLEFNHADVDLEYVIDGRPHVISAGTIAVFWASRPHQLVGGSAPGVETWLTVPLQQALAWRLPAAFLGRMLAGEVSAVPARPAIDLDEFARRWAGELDDEGLARRIAETEIEAFTLRVASDAGDVEVRSEASSRRAYADPRMAAPRVAAPRVAAPRLAAVAMAAYVSEHSASDIAVADVADHVHLNPQYAMSVFRGALGITIGDYLAQCRVASAQQLLLTTDLPIPDIGFAAGFRSQSQFYDRFARWCGQSPSAYRRRLRSA